MKGPSPQPSPRLCRGEGAEQSAARMSPFGLSALLLFCSSALLLFCSSALQLFSSSALQLFSFRRRAAVAHRVRATMARCSTRGPCAAVRWGRQARRGVDRDVDSFSPGQDALSKSPAPAHGLAGHGCPASAKWGGLSLWLSFSLTTQRESNSGAEGARKLCFLEPCGAAHFEARTEPVPIAFQAPGAGYGVCRKPILP
jgi:hypothetical protein